MYNRERKEQFLKERRERATIGTNTEIWFEAAEYFESKYQKDLCEWNTSQIIEFMRYISTPRIQTLILMKNSLSIYANWCQVNNLIPDNQNHYSELSSIDLCQCVDTNKLKELILTREELLENINKLPNPSDQVIFLGLFEGIGMKDYELVNIKVSDLNGNNLTLCTGETWSISDELKYMIYRADEEKYYYSMGSRELRYDVLDKPEVIREIQSRRIQKNSRLLISTRFIKCLDYMGLPSEISQKDIIEAGRLDFIKKIMEKENTSFEEALTNYKQLHETRYGAIQNYIIYVYLYKSFIGL